VVRCAPVSNRELGMGQWGANDRVVGRNGRGGIVMSEPGG
jgi:hypothetical protein